MPQYQNVLDSPNTNTIFMVWNFKEYDLQRRFQKALRFGYQS